MAALTPKLLFQDGGTGSGTGTIRFCLYSVTNATNADTISVSAQFSRVITAATFNVSRAQTYDAPAISGTTITLDEAASANDELRVVVIGSPA